MAEKQQAHQHHVFLVEDDSVAVGFITEALSREGYACEAAASCTQALESFKRGRYACALIDLGLPDGDGTSLIRRFRDEDPCLVQIVMTGDLSANSVVSSMRAGAFDYLMKPVDLMTLTTAVARAVSHHAIIVERAELFRLLYEEREQLRARVDAATADIRQYASACETSNARLRALLHLTQISSNYYSDEAFLRVLLEEISHHLPLRAIVMGDPASRQIAVCCLRPDAENEDDREEVYGGVLEMEINDYDPILAEAEPLVLARMWVQRYAAVDVEHLAAMVFPQRVWNRPACLIGFFFDSGFRPDASEREFVDMCAYLLAFEWERGKLLLHVAQQASLGSIAIELVRNFVQPLTAIRTAVDVLEESAEGSDAEEGAQIIRQSVERLQHQTQEFRKLSTLRKNVVETVRLEDYVTHAVELLSVAIQNRNVTIVRDVRDSCECVLLNGTALARTFLDLLLGALRSVDVGGTVWVGLRALGDDYAVFELRHDGRSGSPLVDGSATPVASGPGDDGAPLGMRLAERTVHGCGGTLTVEFDDQRRATLRITLPRNATNPLLGSGALP